MKIIVVVLLSLVFVLGVATYFYINDFYKSSDYVEAIIQANDTRVEYKDNLTILYPQDQADRNESIGLIFYPGGKVEDKAYLPLLLQLSDLGITCVMAEMPGNLAVLNIDAADDIYPQFPNIKSWYLAGHSLGGAMASQYSEDNHDKIQGLILMGAYPVNTAPVKSVAIYGTHDIKLDLDKVALAQHVYEIKDGNHAYFGDYGEQDGDGQAKISRASQQSQTVEIVKQVIFGFE